MELKENILEQAQLEDFTVHLIFDPIHMWEQLIPVARFARDPYDMLLSTSHPGPWNTFFSLLRVNESTHEQVLRLFSRSARVEFSVLSFQEVQRGIAGFRHFTFPNVLDRCTSYTVNLHHIAMIDFPNEDEHLSSIPLARPAYLHLDLSLRFSSNGLLQEHP